MAPRDENNKMHGAAISAIIISILGAAVFVYLLKYQADDMAAQSAQSTSAAQSYAECLKGADTVENMTACTPS